VARSIFNSNGSNFVTLGQISNERVEIRTETILNLVSTQKRRVQEKGGKVAEEEKNKKKDRAFASQ